MHVSPPEAPQPEGRRPALRPLNDALIAQLHAAGAADVDHGLKLLLHEVLALAHARHVTFTLLDDTLPGAPVEVARETAGLWAVDTPHPVPAGDDAAAFDHPIRSGRRLRLQFVPARPDAPVDTDALVLLLSALHRWLLWLDLSYGPVNDRGVMSRHHRRVLLTLLKGLSEKQVAAELNLSQNTAHQYVTMLFRRYGVRNRASLMARWLGPQG